MPSARQNKKFFFCLILLILIVVFSNLYHYFIKKDFDIYFETECDPAIEKCFYRSCEDDECPPNELELYKTYEIKALDFHLCENDDCKVYCENTEKCEEIICDGFNGGTCMGN